MAVQRGEVALAWDVPMFSGWPVTQYVVQMKASGTSAWSDATTVMADTRKTLLTGLPAGATHEFRVMASNIMGAGQPSTPLAVYLAPARPLPPANVSSTDVTVCGGGSCSEIARLTWKAPSDTGAQGVSVTEYLVTQIGGDPAEWIDKSLSGATRQLDLSHLVPGQQARYVRLHIVVSCCLAPPPSLLRTADRRSCAGRVGEAYKCPALSSHHTTNVYCITLSALLHRFYIKAKTVHGISDPSPTLTLTAPASSPASVDNVIQTAAAPRSLSISWTAPSNHVRNA